MNALVVKSAGAFWRHPSAVLIGALTGLALVLWWPLVLDLSERVTDSAYPVILSQSRLISKTDTEAVVGVMITKQRDCDFRTLQGYSRMRGGVLHSAHTERVDFPVMGVSRPAGATYDAGQWKVWPVAGAEGVVLYVQHDCGGRIVSSTFADVRF